MSSLNHASDLIEKEIVMLAPLPAPRKRPRLAKMIPIFRQAGYRVLFFGWERVPGEMQELAWSDSEVQEKAILHGGGHVTRKARLMYPIWMLVVFWRVLLLGRGRVLFCLGWETAFPARIAAFVTGAKVVFDDADRFSMILHLPGPLHRLLQSLEKWTSRNCTLHIIPGWTRYDWRGENMIVLRNTPTLEDFEAARRLAPQRPDADLVVYANGWLVDTRGAPIFLEALRRLENRDFKVKMHIAGIVDTDAGRELIAHPLVIFYGEIPQRDALALYPASDVVLTYYDPDVPINRQAESNKWGDCIFFGVPFIVNSEVETAKEFIETGAAWGVPYRDVDALVGLFEKLSRDKSKLLAGRDACARFIEHYPVFDVQIHKIIEILSN
ncbi:MAG: hypothetical protein IT528_07520 [Nitrosomonas sp.]|nr:hypothetical protein [Nitrosomonas sp.]MCC7136225.1 hypothetical protein [Nitrosomonas sp.]